MKITEVNAALPMTNVERAVEFYETILGLTVTRFSDDPVLYWIEAADARILLYQRDETTRAEHTVLSLQVDDIQTAVAELIYKGIKFVETKGNPIHQIGNSQSAWFNDTEGNFLEISERG